MRRLKGRMDIQRQSGSFIISKSKTVLHKPRQNEAAVRAGGLPLQKIGCDFSRRLAIYFYSFRKLVSGISLAKKTNCSESRQTWKLLHEINVGKITVITARMPFAKSLAKRMGERERRESGAMAVVIMSVAVTNSILPIWQRFSGEIVREKKTKEVVESEKEYKRNGIYSSLKIHSAEQVNTNISTTYFSPFNVLEIYRFLILASKNFS